MVRPLGRRSQPEIPVKVHRYRRRLFRPLAAAPTSPGPSVNLGHGANGAGLKSPLDHAAIVVAGVNCVPICVASLSLPAVSAISRASATVCVSGFSQ